jgi:hypothetical protein
MTNPWLTHVSEYRKKHPNLSYKEVLVSAKSSYKPVGKKKKQHGKREMGAVAAGVGEGLKGLGTVATALGSTSNKVIDYTQHSKDSNGQYKSVLLKKRLRMIAKLKKQVADGKIAYRSDSEIEKYVNSVIV